MLASFTIDDPIVTASDDCVEVTITLDDGRRRWCFFITPEYLARGLGGYHPTPKPHDHTGFSITTFSRVGEKLTAENGTSFGMITAPHMIVVTELSEAVIAETLRYLDSIGELKTCSKALRKQ
jgi:hypothetical protein